MKVKQFSMLFLAGLFWLVSCKKDDMPATTGHYTEGVFVVNEGPFGGTGAITWHNPETGETVQDVFGQANNGAVLGAFVQSLTLHNGKAYIVVNGANKIVVVNAVTFVLEGVIEGFELPRFFFPLDNERALVSQWGADGLTGSIATIDLTTNQIIFTTPAGKGPEKFFKTAAGAILVANSGGFGTDSTCSNISANPFQHFTVGGKNPACMAEIGSNANLFILCKGDYLDPSPAGFLDNRPVAPAVENDQVVPVFSDDLVSAPDRNTLYFTGGGAIYEVTATGFRKLFDQAAYGLGSDPATGNLFCADAKDFNSAGEVVIYKPSGEKVGAFAAGIAPGEVVFIR